MMQQNLKTSLRTIAWSGVKQLIRSQFPTVKHLSIADLTEWLQQPDREPPLLLDRRTVAEFEISHLAHAHLCPANWQELPEWKEWGASRAIVTYCSVGYRSSRLAEQLQETGFTQVFNLEGSIFAWANAGYPLYRKDQLVTQVHPYNTRWGLLLDPQHREIDKENGGAE